MSDSKREIREPGIVRTITGTLVNLNDIDPDTLNIGDIAWALGRIIRYNGHIKQDYTVAHHCVVMSYLVPEEYALEALLHDAEEAYTGDIIWPVKALFPEMEGLLSYISGHIMAKFAPDVPIVYKEHPFDPPFEQAEGDDNDFIVVHPRYTKSDIVHKADEEMLQHECFSFERPGKYSPAVERAWNQAYEEHANYWHGPWIVYEERFRQLVGDREIDNDLIAATVSRGTVDSNGEGNDSDG